MIDDIRPDKRLRWSADVDWVLEDKDQAGSAVFVDVSRDGAQMVVEAPFDGQVGDTLVLGSTDLEGVLPSRATIRWVRPSGGDAPGAVCGIRFINADPVVWSMWLKTLAMREAARRAEREAADYYSQPLTRP